MRDVIGSAGIDVTPRVRSLALLLLVAIATLLGGVVGCRSTADADPVARLASELPADLWAAISSDFTFDEEVTARLQEMNADLLGAYPDEFDIQWWAFSYAGSVREAYESLPIPAESAPVEPFEASVGALVADHLEFWEAELAGLRDAAWHADAEGKVAEWSGVTQTVAEFGLATGSHLEADEVGWSAVFEAADGDPDLVLATWVFSVVSPIVDLERLETVGGTFLIVRVIDAAY